MVVLGLIVGLIMAILAVFILPSISRYRRKKRFSQRPPMPLDKWYKKFYDNYTNKELVTRVHQALGKEIGVDATQVYPGDRFDRELRCTEWWGSRGHELEGFELWLESFIGEKRKEIPKGFPASTTIGELISELESLLS